MSLAEPARSRLLSLLAKHDCHDGAWWKEDLSFYINCNDAFCWASADCEPVQDDKDVDALEAALNEASHDGLLLYVARARKVRPQGAMYAYIEEKNWPLFNACGPERPVTFGNPMTPEQALERQRQKQQELAAK